MSIEKRDNLLGAWAIHCDGTDCHMEVLNLSETDVLSTAKTDGWAIDGLKHECPDCVAGNSPAEAIKEAAAAQQQAGAQPPQPQAAAPNPEPSPTDDDISDPVEMPEAEDEEPFDVASLFGNGTLVKRKPSEPKEKFEPFDERSGDTIPGLTAAAEDIETPEDKAKREAREKRQRARLRESQAASLDKTRAAMGGVDALLDDFDGMFGNSSTTWDD